MTIRYNSLEELRERCTSNDLKACVSSVLRCDKYMTWRFLSGSQDGTACHADFVCHDEARGFIGRLSYELNELGRYAHITVEDLHSSAATK